MKKILIGFFSMSFLFVTGCASTYNTVPQYVSTVTAGQLSVMRDIDTNFYISRIENRVAQFESDLASAKMRALVRAENEGVLTASGILYLEEQIARLKDNFNRDMSRARGQLQSRISTYNNLIELQGKVNESFMRIEQARAAATRRVAEAAAQGLSDFERLRLEKIKLREEEARLKAEEEGHHEETSEGMDSVDTQVEDIPELPISN